MKLKILVIVAHSDDEALGLGGTINRHYKNGDKVYTIAMTDGLSSRGNISLQLLNERQDAAKLSAKTLGFEWIEVGNFPDNNMDSIPLLDVVKFIEKAKNNINPDIIYTHSSADLNIDHRIVNQATLTAFRPQNKELWKEIRTFEVPSSTEWGDQSSANLFKPNIWIDISQNWQNKLKSLKNYHMEMREYPHPRSYEAVENLAKYRGSQVGLYYAESFELIKKIER